MLFFASSGCNSFFQSAHCNATSSRTIFWIRLNVSVELKPSGPTSLVSLCICCLMPATRISKNSSRFELKMVRNLTRSMSGCAGSCASSSTRRLNASQLNSRLIKFFGSPNRSWALWTICGTAVASLFSSVWGVAWACGMLNDCRSSDRTQRAVSGTGREILVSDVFCRSGVNGLLGHVSSMIAHALESPCNENQVQVAAQLPRVLRHAINQLAADSGVQFIQVFVALNNSTPKIDIFPNERVYAVLKHGHCMLMHGPDQFDFSQRWMLIQLAGASRNRRRLIGHPLEI